MKLRLASLAHVLGVCAAVHKHGRFVRVCSGCKTWFSLCRPRTQLKKHRQRLP